MLKADMSKEEMLKTMKKDKGIIDKIVEERNKAIDRIFETIDVSKSDKEDSIISSYEALDIIKAQVKARKGYIVGFPRLDRMIGGFEQGELVVISGITAMGKTALAQSFTHNLSNKNIECVWFSYEIGLKSFIERFGSKIPLFFLPKKLIKNTIDWIKEKIIEAQLKYEVKFVFIDHLHYLIRLAQSANQSLIIGEIMRQLKRFAIERELVVMIIAHTQKIRYDAVPDLADLRDSSFVAQEADVCMIVKRCGEINKKTKEIIFNNSANLYLLKNRRKGETGKIGIIMQNGIFYEQAG